jgi:hypothetical protein
MTLADQAKVPIAGLYRVEGDMLLLWHLRYPLDYSINALDYPSPLNLTNVAAPKESQVEAEYPMRRVPVCMRKDVVDS